MLTTGAQTFGRGLELLKLIVAADEPLSLSEMARALDVNRNAAYRLLAEMEAQSFVVRRPSDRCYVIGQGLVLLATTVMRKLTLPSLARPAMERVNAATLETVTLHARFGRQRVCIEVVAGRHEIRRVVQLGETVPLHGGPSGKVIVAHLPADEAEEVLAEAVAAGADRERLNELLASVRRLGYLALIGDRVPSVAGLSAPIFDASGVVASMTVSGPGDRWGEEAMARAAPLLVTACREVSASLGHDPNLQFAEG